MQVRPPGAARGARRQHHPARGQHSQTGLAPLLKGDGETKRPHPKTGTPPQEKSGEVDTHATSVQGALSVQEPGDRPAAAGSRPRQSAMQQQRQPQGV